MPSSRDLPGRGLPAALTGGFFTTSATRGAHEHGTSLVYLGLPFLFFGRGRRNMDSNEDSLPLVYVRPVKTSKQKEKTEREARTRRVRPPRPHGLRRSGLALCCRRRAGLQGEKGFRDRGSRDPAPREGKSPPLGPPRGGRASSSVRARPRVSASGRSCGKGKATSSNGLTGLVEENANGRKGALKKSEVMYKCH